MFTQADVYVPELHGWDEFSLRHLQDLSYGRLTPKELLAETAAREKSFIQDPVDKKNYDPEKNDPMHGFRKAQLEMIYNSYKPIIIFDIPDEDPRRAKLEDHEFGREDESGEVINESFERHLAKIKENLRIITDLHNEREDYMLSQITPQLEEVFKQRPDLRNKKDLKILMFLGSVHTRVAHKLKEYGIEVESHQSRSPQIYGFNEEARRRFAMRKEVSNELAARIWLEDLSFNVLGSIIDDLTKDANKMTTFIRKIVTLFSYQEIKFIYDIGLPGAVHTFLSYLAKKKVNLPRNSSELNSFIAR